MLTLITLAISKATEKKGIGYYTVKKSSHVDLVTISIIAETNEAIIVNVVKKPPKYYNLLYTGATVFSSLRLACNDIVWNTDGLLSGSE